MRSAKVTIPTASAATLVLHAVVASVQVAAANPALPTDPRDGGEPQARLLTGPEPTTATGELEEVVVSAEKRQANIQSVPISITALSSDALENLGARTFADYAQTVPGVSFASGGPGLNRIAIRGVSSSGGSSATVGYYIDDTPISDIRYNPDPELTDLARVEVLRGPQGTLYGSGSMGGTIKLVTNQPKMNEWSGSVTGTLSDTSNGGLNNEEAGVLNMPLVTDVAAIRVAVFHRRTDGFIDRVAPNLTNPTEVDPNAPIQKRVNVFDSHGFRAAIAIRPVDDLTITPSVFYQRFTLDDPQTVDVPPANASNLIQLRISPEPETDSFTLTNLSIRYTPGPVELVSTTSLYRRHQTDVEDASRFIYFVFAPQQTYLAPTTDTENRENHSFTQEVRLESTTDGALHWLAGIFYSKIKAPFGVHQPAPGFNAAFNLGLPPDELIFGESRRIDTRETAGFGQVSYKIAAGLAATAGLRWSSDKQSFTDTQTGFFASNSTNVGASSETSTNPKYELSYQVTPQALTYISAARGYRLGGAITPPPVPLCNQDLQAIGLSSPPSQYNSDHLWSYELGSKTDWLGNRLVVNVAAYYIKWNDIQQNITLEKCGYNFTGNAGTATSKGGELEIRATPAPGLVLTSSASYTDAVITEAAAGTGVQAGQPVLETPRWNLAGNAEYRRPLSGALDGFVHFDTMFTSSAHTYFATTDPAYRRNGYSLSNFRIGVGRKEWEVALFVRNVFDRFAILQFPTPLTADVPYYRRASIEQPRTVGLTGRFTF